MKTCPCFCVHAKVTFEVFMREKSVTPVEKNDTHFRPRTSISYVLGFPGLLNKCELMRMYVYIDMYIYTTGCNV
jgi:hypothetical protein